MKKTLALLLATIMCFSFASCRSAEEENNSITPAETEQTTEKEPEKEAETEVQTPDETAKGEETAETAALETSISDTDIAETTPSETEAPASPSFDTSWAGAAYEMPIPEPPFRADVTFGESGNMYTVINADTADEIRYDSIAAYCDTLKSIGYTNIERDVPSESDFTAQYDKTGGAATAFIAQSGNGHRVVISKEFSTWMVMVYCPKEKTPSAAPSFDTSWAANEFEALLPKLPFEGWTTKQNGDSEYKMELGGLKDSVITDDSGNTVGYGEDKEALIAYLESLTEYGFSVEETGGIEGYQYEWKVIDPTGNKIKVVCAEGYCWITINKK